jgi:hypothetical protein
MKAGIGTLGLVFAVITIVKALVEYVMKARETVAAPIAPPAIPRRTRRTRPPALKSSPEPVSEVPPVLGATHLDASNLQVTRPAHAKVCADFRGRGALRRAMIAREVLGPPLALRPPRG